MLILRNLQGIETKFPKNTEIRSFVKDFGKLLAEAMSLRNKDISAPG